MPTYIMLLNYTPQGLKDVREAPQRTDVARQVFQRLGVNLKECYAVTGQYDEIAIIDAPNEEAASRAAHALASQGNVGVQTLRAFSQDEHRKLLETLPR